MNSETSDSTLVNLYRSALRVRMVEEAIAKDYHLGEMKTPTHLYTGEEGIAAGLCANLRKSDLVFAYYRSHGWYLAKGGNLNSMMGELFGKATGCSGGYGGSMHLIDLDMGIQGTTALVAAAMPHAVGTAFSQKYRKLDDVTVCAFGDGATEEGVFQESLMFAALRKLPAIFVCENNGIATNTLISYRQPPVPIYKRAEGFGVPSFQVDGNDAVAVYEVAREAVARARRGDGPTFIEAITFRMLEHCGPNYDYSLGVRTAEDIENWKTKDPVLRLEKKLSSDVCSRIRKEIETDISEAFAFARKSPFPTSLVPEGYQCL